MPSSDWSTETPAPDRRPSPAWMKAALVLLAIPLAVWALGYARAQAVKAGAWPVLLGVFQRLQTDADARELYQANPGLKKAYQSEDAFLQRVQAYRAQFASLPDRPSGGRERYECFAEPIGFLASVKGSGPAWATVEVRSTFLFWNVPGEGLLRLEFAPSREATDEARRAVRKARRESEGRRYREVCLSLATDAGARDLWRREPGLQAAFPREADLLAFSARVRPHLAARPEEAGGPRFRLQRQVQWGAAGESVRLGHAFPAGTLTVVWTEGKLAGLEFAPR